MLASLGHCDVCTERSAIVGWLRTFDAEKGIDYLADAIEAGEHWHESHNAKK
jgi:predicted DCC family thiol-disulfide oxidoreductase YuxK